MCHVVGGCEPRTSYRVSFKVTKGAPIIYVFPTSKYYRS